MSNPVKLILLLVEVLEHKMKLTQDSYLRADTITILKILNELARRVLLL